MVILAKKRQELVDNMVGRLSSEDCAMLANQLGNREDEHVQLYLSGVQSSW